MYELPDERDVLLDEPTELLRELLPLLYELPDERDVLLDEPTEMCGKPLHGLKIVEDCAIPQTRGLGSSSACTVAGILGANALLGNPLNQENIIDLAASIEGHPDNSTPAILGGFCVALLEYGKVWSVRVPMNGTVDFITFIPDFELSTEKARAALPRQVAHHDAVFNLARAALLAGSLTTGKLENVGVAVSACLI